MEVEVPFLLSGSFSLITGSKLVKSEEVLEQL
jgi:hypothetical protein